MSYRPWGLLDWALNLSESRQWDFVGALGTEDRSLAAWKWLRELNSIGNSTMLEIRDLPSRHTILENELLSHQKNLLQQLNQSKNDVIISTELMLELHKILEIANRIEETCSSLILDITSLPKRFFFPILRHFYLSDKIGDLIITYTSPKEYANDEPLSEGATDWINLPGFRSFDTRPETLIASVGFMVESMQNHITTIEKHESIKMIIPFPAPMSILKRTWESVYRLQSGRSPEKFEHFRIAGTDLPATFDRILSIKRDSSHSLAFAPFGPKPLSAAMCIAASLLESAVYYPQPRSYHPRYSTGVSEWDGKHAVFAYWIKHQGTKLYTL